MSDKITENRELAVDAFELSLLNRDKNGKFLIPLSPIFPNFIERINKDESMYFNHSRETSRDRGLLQIEDGETESVKGVLKKAINVVYQSINGTLPSKKDLKDLATYLDWSYQQQVGVPASSSSQKEAAEHGIGAIDTWALFTSIKNKLEKENEN